MNSKLLRNWVLGLISILSFSLLGSINYPKQKSIQTRQLSKVASLLVKDLDNTNCGQNNWQKTVEQNPLIFVQAATNTTTAQ